MKNTELYSIQFLHQITTSWPDPPRTRMLYSIQFLHQITTVAPLVRGPLSCIVSNFYIKSQHPCENRRWDRRLYSIQFLHQITTVWKQAFGLEPLYSIQFLHQITTHTVNGYSRYELYSIQFLHQITTRSTNALQRLCCIVSNFYIKSQHR